MSARPAVLLFGGTTEGRQLAFALRRRGFPLTVCVATPYGAGELAGLRGARVLAGRLDQSQMAGLMGPGCGVVVDATHPYAREVSRNIAAASARAGVPCLRLLRPAEPLPPGCLTADTAAEAADLLESLPGSVLLTTGSKELPVFAARPGLRERLYVRVLPAAASLEVCRGCGIPPRRVEAAEGPFTQQQNEELLRRFGIAVLVTKESGAAGGFPQKAAAARACGARLLVLRRPAERGLELPRVLEALERMNVCDEAASPAEARKEGSE